MIYNCWITENIFKAWPTQMLYISNLFSFKGKRHLLWFDRDLLLQKRYPFGETRRHHFKSLPSSAKSKGDKTEN